MDIWFLITSLITSNFQNERQILSQISDNVMTSIFICFFKIPIEPVLVSEFFCYSRIQARYSIRVTRNLYLSHLVRNFIVDIMSYRMHVLATARMYLFLKYGPDISIFVVTFSN